MIDTTIDTSKMEAAIRELAKVTRKDVSVVMRRQAGILVGHVIAVTPPGASKGQAMSDTGGIQLSAKKRGESVIAADIARLFPTTKLSDGAAYALAENGFEFQVGKGHKSTVREFAPSVEDLARIHKFARNPKSGRTTKASGANMAITRKAVLKQYIKQEQAKVGKLNAGWLRAAQELKTAGRAVPAWIKRHGNKPGGAEVRDGGGKVAIRIFNQQAWFPLNMESRFRYALNRREAGLKKEIEVLLEKQAAKASAKMR
jgi:hypothetical protein